MPESEPRLIQRLEAAMQPQAWPESLRRRAAAVRVDGGVGIAIGDEFALLRIDGERTGLARRRSPLTPWVFALRGSAVAWFNLWHPVPAPGWHDLFALSKRGELQIEGNLLPFMTHLQFFKDLLALPRLDSPS